jgi:hypothetical protein
MKTVRREAAMSLKVIMEYLTYNCAQVSVCLFPAADSQLACDCVGLMMNRFGDARKPN